VANGEKRKEILERVVEWFPKDSRIRVFCTDVSNLTFSLNLGLHEARGHLVARMDADDLSESDRLERQVRFLEENPDVVVLGSSYSVINNEGVEIRKIVLPVNDESIRRALIYKNPLCHPSIMYRRDVILKAGGYMGGIHAEDYDLWLRLSSDSNIKFHNLKEILLKYREDSAGPARKSRQSYAASSGSLLAKFANGEGVIWLMGCVVTVIKSIVFSRKRRRIKL
jgi:glycosyltransferase involved in cell wall biosynthesis